MRAFQTVLVICVSLSGLCAGQQSQQLQGIDPAYLRQYYQQVAQQAGASGESTPIFEQNPEPSQQYSQSTGQQIRHKDNAQDQVKGFILSF